MLPMLVKVVLPHIATMRMVVVVTQRQAKYYVTQELFHRTTGSLLKDEEPACCLWSYRKARPNKDSGSADMVPADGEAMLNEMRAIRESLRSFIMDKFLSDM